MTLYALTFVATSAEAASAVAAKARALAAEVGEVKAADRLGPAAHDLIVETDHRETLANTVRIASGDAAVDVCLQPASGRRKRLLLADMDSTLIGCEGLDELADYAGVKDEVAAITERAMRGEIAFEGALRERVSRLRGMGEAMLERCYQERVRLNAGAATLGRTLSAHGVRCVLVSGGFDVFSARVAAEAGFAVHHANRLLVEGGKLTGEVGEPILGREAKLEALERHAQGLGVGRDESAAIGDGANDLQMIEAAGLGVAYRAKPVVAGRADARIDHADLTAMLYFQGYRVEDFVLG